MKEKILKKEISFYELIKVNKYRDFINSFRNALVYLFLPKEERKDIMNESKDNFNLGVIKNKSDIYSLEDSYLYLSFFHIVCIILLLFFMPSNIFLLMINILFILINIYSLFNQRYNMIKLKEVVKIKEIIKKNVVSETDNSNRINLDNNVKPEPLDNLDINDEIDIEKILNNSSYEELVKLRNDLTNKNIVSTLSKDITRINI